MNRKTKFKRIPLLGINTEGSERTAPQGALSKAEGLQVDKGGIKAIPPFRRLHSPVMGGKQMKLVHKMRGRTNYILSDGAALYWVDKLSDVPNAEAHKKITVIAEALLSDIKSIGNTLILATEEGLHYYLFKKGAYNSLGRDIPKIDMNFSLYGETVYDITMASSDFPMWGKEAFDGIYAKTNKFVTSYATNKNKFYHPFLLRYAIRLYDGSHSFVSDPILMLANSFPPIFDLKGSGDRLRGRVSGALGIVSDITYYVKDDYREVKSYWGDVISGIDIYISQPLFTYEQDPRLTEKEMNKGFRENTTNEFWLDNFLGNISLPLLVHLYRDYRNSKELYFIRRGGGRPPGEKEFIENQTVKKELFMGDIMKDGPTGLFTSDKGDYSFMSAIPKDIFKQASENTVYYKLASIELSQLSSSLLWTTVPIKDGVLATLPAQEQLKEDGSSIGKLAPKKLFVYNNRLIGYNASKSYAISHLDALRNAELIEGDKKTYRVFIETEDNEGGIHTIGGTTFTFDPSNVPYFYYPDRKATALILVEKESGRTYRTALDKHQSANAAIFCDASGLSLSAVDTEAGNTTAERPMSYSEDVSDRIYMTEEGNPFIFPDRHVVTAGTGRILGLGVVTKALSEGQFGQFPLYAFTTEGVWAMSISSDGRLSGRHPISRDVCINPESITPIDNAIVFASKRGLMLISGSTSVCISEQLHERAGFTHLLQQGKVIYDYTGERIFFFTPRQTNKVKEGTSNETSGLPDAIPAQETAYVYGLKTRQWGEFKSNLYGTINSYPEAWGVEISYPDKTNVLGTEVSTVDLSEKRAALTADKEEESRQAGNDSLSDKQRVNDGLIETRAIILEPDEAFKTITTLAIRGEFDRRVQGLELFGTRDYETWHRVSDCKGSILRGIRGTGYKAFKLKIHTKLKKNETISFVEIEYIPKETNQLR